jgi:hypothetical protein
MDNIIQSIENLVQEYAVAISEEYDIDIQELEQLWIKISKKKVEHKKSVNKKPKEVEEKKTVNKKSQKPKEDEDDEDEKPLSSYTKSKKSEEEKPKSKSIKKPKDDDEEEEQEKKGDGQCQYVYTRKPKAGERCTVKVKNGGCYCSTHKAYENKSPKEKTVIPKVSKSQKESPKKELPKKESPKKEVVIKPTFIPNRDINKHVHPDTNLVLKSASDKKIIGRLENKKIVDLNEEDIENCKKWGFRIDEEQLKKFNKEEEENEEEEENIVEHYLIKESWSTDEECINGKINKEKLESLIKKKVVKGEYDEEYESEGYPVSLDIDKKNKKIILKYTDGKGKENNINITSSSDENLSKLFDYINDLKSDSKSDSKKEDKKQDDNLSKKSPKKEVKKQDDEDDIEDIEDILEEVEEEEEDDEELLEDDE